MVPSEVLISPSFPLQFHLQVRTELAALIPVLQWFESHGRPFLPESLLWQCKVALAEGFTNTVRYAHKNLPPTTPIDLELTFSSHSLEIKIWDHGQPFDLQAKLDSPQQDPVAPLEMESDRGLLLMRSLTDTLQYIRTGEGKNCLILQKSF
ncbi:MAG: ATP-binding protein [Microcystis panniformis Mp_MB_F_20051200_S9]|uniref:ATP-binding protein n=1 Tax=Microcystis panniformis Mp_MB_F_20051200_S9 TaxID=2486223 RepID=A0A552Q9T4_9CHRO|nr:MAG: ATP-binding protein [Microcystis panniformis Mp_MB_F_20080800_S26D]TRV51422.1 MAG: ATP-binding protein [Microcystis panniformis Mp_GB_SS_20050300_S99D]TRV51885.1 MAG: ATP-binding protein [Microcystis panniformis Mp_GB_SS_20050300_S99]TRV58968.1 MAG: ATP-binding protein [Microcystis panniformis Mp_MB_F_20080800_S26]TRV59907.1 MAG: ATP-binding protein [Microcystis panniformis Mp_MB_F_20051200_S9D]TRV65919.1 MAG: ATP-binding protein [Microcystis panniformis Mp_MB_F_20051200_S9]TRV66838.1